MTADIRKLSDLRLVIHFDIHEPIKLNELTRSFNAMADLYKTALPKNAKGKAKNEDVELYITEIKDNCILVKLASILEVANVLSSDAEQLATFNKSIQKLSAVISILSVIGAAGSLLEFDDNPSKRYTDYASVMAEAIVNKGDGNLHIYLEETEENTDGSKKTTLFKLSQGEAINVIEGKKIVDEVRQKTSETKEIKEIKQQMAPPKAIPRPSQPTITITIKDGFIYYENGNLSVSVEINNIESMDYVNETSSARIVKINIDDTNLPCTQQQFDKMIDDIEKAKITNN